MKNNQKQLLLPFHKCKFTHTTDTCVRGIIEQTNCITHQSIITVKIIR